MFHSSNTIKCKIKNRFPHLSEASPQVKTKQQLVLLEMEHGLHILHRDLTDTTPRQTEGLYLVSRNIPDYCLPMVLLFSTCPLCNDMFFLRSQKI